MKYYIMPFGCQMNRSDSERIRSVLNAMGLTESTAEYDPEIRVRGIVACSVRQKAIDRVYGRIRNWNNTGTAQLTFLSGCVLDADREHFLKLFDFVFPVDQVPQLPEMLAGHPVFRDYGDSPDVQPPDPVPPGADCQSEIEDFWNISPQYSSETEACVPIQNGCNKFCSFCAVPYTRGREVSRSSADILTEVKSLIQNGCRSVTLLGQNVNSYGLDRKGQELSFTELLRAVGETGNETQDEFLVYFTSPHPRDFDRELLETMARYNVLANWIHLPLQSGDDEVLKQMNRNHSMRRYRQIVQDIREILPDVSLFTDIIVGFPGETEEQFQNTAKAMEEFCYDMAWIAKYSPRPGALSARREDDISREEKERRYRILSQILQNKAAIANQKRVGSAQRVLLTHNSRGYLNGCTEGRIPIRVKTDAAAPGNFADVEITSARPLSLEGRLIR